MREVMMSTGMKGKKRGKKRASGGGPPLFYIFFSRERFNNWLNILKEASFDLPKSGEGIPEGYSTLLSFTEDITISVMKIMRLFQNGRFTREETEKRLKEVEEIVMAPVDGEIGDIVGSMQLNLLVLFAACRRYLEGDFDDDIKSLVKEGRKIGDSDPGSSLRLAAEIGAAVIGGASCCGRYLRSSERDLTIFDEWLNEIDLISNAMKSLSGFDEEGGEVF
ncbi:MAG: DUF2150 family protein [Methanoculleaceae archaeon]